MRRRNRKQERINALDDFTKGYLECALWIGLEEQHKGYILADFTTGALDILCKDCQDFQEEAKDLLSVYYESMSKEQAGHDFWLTRNQHGTGFWDRDGVPQEILYALSAICRVYSDCDLGVTRRRVEVFYVHTRDLTHPTSGMQ